MGKIKTAVKRTGRNLVFYSFVSVCIIGNTVILPIVYITKGRYKPKDSELIKAEYEQALDNIGKEHRHILTKRASGKDVAEQVDHFSHEKQEIDEEFQFRQRIYREGERFKHYYGATIAIIDAFRSIPARTLVKKYKLNIGSYITDVHLKLNELKMFRLQLLSDNPGEEDTVIDKLDEIIYELIHDIKMKPKRRLDSIVKKHGIYKDPRGNLKLFHPPEPKQRNLSIRNGSIATLSNNYLASFQKSASTRHPSIASNYSTLSEVELPQQEHEDKNPLLRKVKSQTTKSKSRNASLRKASMASNFSTISTINENETLIADRNPLLRNVKNQDHSSSRKKSLRKLSLKKRRNPSIASNISRSSIISTFSTINENGETIEVPEEDHLMVRRVKSVSQSATIRKLSTRNQRRLTLTNMLIKGLEENKDLEYDYVNMLVKVALTGKGDNSAVNVDLTTDFVTKNMSRLQKLKNTVGLSKR